MTTGEYILAGSALLVGVGIIYAVVSVASAPSQTTTETNTGQRETTLAEDVGAILGGVTRGLVAGARDNPQNTTNAQNRDNGNTARGTTQNPGNPHPPGSLAANLWDMGQRTYRGPA